MTEDPLEKEALQWFGALGYRKKRRDGCWSRLPNVVKPGCDAHAS
ncbi:hypothetical protein ACYCFK_10240 [Stutzerimonas stutzeri]